MQLDIFEHSRDVMLRNSVIDTLWARNPELALRAMGDLAAEYPGDSMLPVFKLLQQRLALGVIGPLSRVAAGEVLRTTEGSLAAAKRVFGRDAESWLAPLWSELATATTGLPFDARAEVPHATLFFMRAGITFADHPV